MTKEARDYLIKTEKGFDPITDEAYAVVPEGTKHIAIGQVMLFKKRKTFIYLVWIDKNKKIHKKLIRESEAGKEIYLTQVINNNKEIIIFVDTGKGYMHLDRIEKIIIEYPPFDVENKNRHS